MDFRTAARVVATSDPDITGMSLDPTAPTSYELPPPAPAQPDPATDGQDPATPGGPAPYNGAEPFSEPVVTDPMWLDPQRDDKNLHGQPMPHKVGPHEDVTTLHNARRASYDAQITRFR